MSREIKFRAWVYYGDKLDKPMYSRDFQGLDRFFEDCCESDEGQVIEQYTGLKDKNGKEIYEGDIIQEEIDFNSKMTDGIFKYKVYWDEEELCWALEHIGNESIHHELWQCNFSTEVIGNIHENPELLEKEK